VGQSYKNQAYLPLSFVAEIRDQTDMNFMQNLFLRGSCKLGWEAPYCRTCDRNYIGEGHCTIECITGQGIYKRPDEGSGGTRTIQVEQDQSA